MVIGPWQRLEAHLLAHSFWNFWPKAEMMDSVRENVASSYWGIEVVVEIVDVHVTIAETASWSNVEVPNDLVDSDSSLNTASFLSLGVQSFSVMFAFALFDVLASSESPGNTGISLSHFVASVTAAWLLCVRRWVCAVTSSAVVGV